MCECSFCGLLAVPDSTCPVCDEFVNVDMCFGVLGDFRDVCSHQDHSSVHRCSRPVSTCHHAVPHDCRAQTEAGGDGRTSATVLDHASDQGPSFRIASHSCGSATRPEEGGDGGLEASIQEEEPDPSLDSGSGPDTESQCHDLPAFPSGGTLHHGEVRADGQRSGGLWSPRRPSDDRCVEPRLPVPDMVSEDTVRGKHMLAPPPRRNLSQRSHPE